VAAHRRPAGRRAVLRLKGDYLAIVTLGFGEIIRVILRTRRPSAVRAASP
jgi:ABC-type branched-subunit amino acid transport system permease subunit